MDSSEMRRNSNDTWLLIAIAAAWLLFHTLTNGRYGFHRDELAIIDNARHMAWGYVAYPPLTPAIGRLALALFGPSLQGLRFFSALAMCTVMVLSGLMARELGAGRWAQLLAALSVAIAPIGMIQGALFQYVAFDYLWWVLLAYFVLKLLKTDDSRWWLAIGGVIGAGIMTRFTIAIFVVGLAAGLVLTGKLHHLRSKWLWAGAALSLLIYLPNLLWQIGNSFISLEFLSAIHSRDIRFGRTQGFLPEQFFVPANLFTIPLWVGGLHFYLFNPAGKRFRVLGWMFVTAFLVLLVAQGRSYYLAPAYPMLIAAGAARWEQWLAARPDARKRWAGWFTWAGVAVGGLVFGAVMLPLAPVNSPLWQLSSDIHDNFVEEIGWRELVKTVSDIYTSLPADVQERTGILTGNYGEAGAVNLYGPAYGLPEAISGINSYWLRGYGSPPPDTLIVLGFDLETAQPFFRNCRIVDQITNSFGVINEETRFHPDILLCSELLQPWPVFWEGLKSFG